MSIILHSENHTGHCSCVVEDWLRSVLTFVRVSMINTLFQIYPAAKPCCYAYCFLIDVIVNSMYIYVCMLNG